MIRVLMPVEDGRGVHRDVEAGRAMQTIPYQLITVSRPKYIEDHRASEAECRNILKRYARGEFVIWTDSDVVMTSPTDYADAIAFMQAHPEVGAGAYNTKAGVPRERMKHVVIAWMIMRTDVLSGLTFRGSRGKCNCRGVNEDLAAWGRPIVWIDDRQLREVNSDGTQPTM